MCLKKMIYFAILIFTTISYSQNQIIYSEGTNKNAFTKVEAPSIFRDRLSLAKISTSNFITDYDDGANYVPVDARTAFDKAVEIWSYLISASKPIKIKVEFTPDLSGTALASASIITYRNNIANALFSNMQYPMALAKQIDPSINYTGYDMIIKFKSTASWNFLIDGVPMAGHYDFVTNALHEICHGLGFSGSLRYESGLGVFGFTGFQNNTSASYPVIFDRFTKSGSQRLIEVTNSTTLAGLLTSNNVYFDGSNAKLANNNSNVKLYAPSR